MWKAHDALRADMADLLKALTAMEAAEASETPRGSRVRHRGATLQPLATLPLARRVPGLRSFRARAARCGDPFARGGMDLR